MKSPRFYMPKGRGNAVMKRAPDDQIRLTNEGNYKIDLLSRDVPPEYLQKLPTYKTSDYISDNRSELFFDLYNDDVHKFNIADPKNIQKLPKRLRAETKVLNKDLADNDYHYLTAGLAPSDELIAATVSPAQVARSIINRAKGDDIAYLSRQGYPDIDKALDSWTKMGIENKRVQGQYGSAPLDNGLPAIPELKASVDKYLQNYANKADWDNTEVSDWLMLSPKDLAEFWIDSELSAIKNKNTLTGQDVLPVFSQIKHKLMVPDDRYKGWEYGSYGAYPPTDDIDFRAAATLLESLQRSDRKDLLPQAREILFNNLKYYK